MANPRKKAELRGTTSSLRPGVRIKYTAPSCGPSDGVEADGEGVDVREAVRAATRNAMDVCALYNACDTLNPKCLFKVSKIKITDAADGRKKATAIGTCVCGTGETLPGDLLV